ncbi:MAG TPA: metal-dependent transcriptional regulator [Methanocorpusculum sp.]|nr:metal-dependent transcriptional regulator [Methanocorpusculum sp.]
MDSAGNLTNHKSLTTKEEDYLESILNTSLEKGYARAHDIADDLKVVPSSVSEMFAKLGAKGLVTYRKYEGVTLTESGRKIAEKVKFRHTILVDFLTILGVPKQIADQDACFMEHELNTVTIEKIKEFVRTSQKS